MSSGDQQVIDLLCLLVPELEALLPAETLTIRPTSDDTGIGSIFILPASERRYETGWREHWHRLITMVDIRWLADAGYLSPLGNDSYRLNTKAIINLCQQRVNTKPERKRLF